MPPAATHRWADWAQTWSHCLHRVDSLGAAHGFGLDARDLDSRIEPSGIVQRINQLALVGDLHQLGRADVGGALAQALQRGAGMVAAEPAHACHPARHAVFGWLLGDRHAGARRRRGNSSHSSSTTYSKCSLGTRAASRPDGLTPRTTARRAACDGVAGWKAAVGIVELRASAAMHPIRARHGRGCSRSAPRDHSTTCTPFQNATRPLMAEAASDGSG